MVYVPVVLGVDRLDEKLFESGYSRRLKTLFVVEGLLMYIPPPVVDHLLAFITSMSGPESALVADYFSPAVVDGSSPLKEAQVLRQFVESEGSSLQFGIEPEKIQDFFLQRGFGHVSSLNATACKEKHFKGARRNRSVSKMFNFVHAVIASA